MAAAMLIRLRPKGPWRYGPGETAGEASDALYRSDRVYSAITIAMKQLGQLEPWLAATAEASEPAVTFSSLFPFQGDTLFATPPGTLWPPSPGSVVSPSPVFLAKARWEAARFVPVSLVESLLMGNNILADQWLTDPESGCLLRRDRPSTSPFIHIRRNSAAVDRIDGTSGPVRSTLGVQFGENAGLWLAAQFSDEQWTDRIQSAVRLLGDTGWGGLRRSGWGQTEAPEFQSGEWPALLMPKLARRLAREGEPASDDGPMYWALGLFSPNEPNSVDWSGGSYTTVVRGGRIEDTGDEKKQVRMVAEGSVLSSKTKPVGKAVNVAPDGHPHPVYRSGLGSFVQLHQFAPPQTKPVEGPEPTPCPVPDDEGANEI